MSDTAPSRRETLALLSAAGAVLALGLPVPARAQGRTGTAARERSASSAEQTEQITLDKPLDQLDPDKYNVIRDPAARLASTDTTNRIVCQYGSHYYSDERDAKGVLHIDATEEVSVK